MKFKKKKNIELELKVKTIEERGHSYHGLKILNVVDNPRERSSDTEIKVLQILERSQIYLPSIAIARISREGPYASNKRRPVILHLMHPKDKHLLLSLSKRLYFDSKITVTEDLPQKVFDAKKELLSILKAARRHRHSAVLQEDILEIDGKLFTTDNLSSLPTHLQPNNATTFSNDEMIVFFHKHSPFSNHHITSFKMDEVNFNCSEQAYMYTKAKTLGMRIRLKLY